MLESGSARHQRLEVRFLVRTEPEWVMFTYRFNEAGDDATLLEDQAFVDLTAQTPAGPQPVNYLFPDSDTCRVCHSDAQSVLGFTTEQLNFVYNYGPSAANQLTALWDIAVFDAEPDPSRLPALADPADTRKSAVRRGRSYLHANCAHCHRPGGFAATTGLMLRYDVSLEETQSCGVTTNYYGFLGPNRVEPGFPEESGLLRRMREEDIARMPPVGVSYLDEIGEQAVSDWIESLEECP